MQAVYKLWNLVAVAPGADEAEVASIASTVDNVEEIAPLPEVPIVSDALLAEWMELFGADKSSSPEHVATPADLLFDLPTIPQVADPLAADLKAVCCKNTVVASSAATLAGVQMILDAMQSELPVVKIVEVAQPAVDNVSVSAATLADVQMILDAMPSELPIVKVLGVPRPTVHNVPVAPIETSPPSVPTLCFRPKPVFFSLPVNSPSKRGFSEVGQGRPRQAKSTKRRRVETECAATARPRIASSPSPKATTAAAAAQADLEARLAEKEEALNDKEKALADKQSEVDAKERELAGKQSEVDDLKKEIASFTNGERDSQKGDEVRRYRLWNAHLARENLALKNQIFAGQKGTPPQPAAAQQQQPDDAELELLQVQAENKTQKRQIEQLSDDKVRLEEEVRSLVEAHQAEEAAFEQKMTIALTCATARQEQLLEDNKVLASDYNSAVGELEGLQVVIQEKDRRLRDLDDSNKKLEDEKQAKSDEIEALQAKDEENSLEVANLRRINLEQSRDMGTIKQENDKHLHEISQLRSEYGRQQHQVQVLEQQKGQMFEYISGQAADIKGLQEERAQLLQNNAHLPEIAQMRFEYGRQQQQVQSLEQEKLRAVEIISRLNAEVEWLRAAQAQMGQNSPNSAEVSQMRAEYQRQVHQVLDLEKGQFNRDVMISEQAEEIEAQIVKVEALIAKVEALKEGNLHLRQQMTEQRDRLLQRNLEETTRMDQQARADRVQLIREAQEYVARRERELEEEKARMRQETEEDVEETIRERVLEVERERNSLEEEIYELRNETSRKIAQRDRTIAELREQLSHGGHHPEASMPDMDWDL